MELIIGGNATNPRPDNPDGGSYDLLVAEKQGFEPWKPLWGLLT